MNLEARAIGNLPLSGYRNFQSLINLVPGATPVRFQNAVIDTPQRDFTTNVNGQDRGDNNTRVDGVGQHPGHHAAPHGVRPAGGEHRGSQHLHQ